MQFLISTNKITGETIPMNEGNHAAAMSFRRIHEVIRPWAERQPQALALQDAASRLTYGELATSVHAAAVQLQALGRRAGHRVQLVAENCAALALPLMATSALDAWAVIANVRLSLREIYKFVKHSGSRPVLHTTEVSSDAKDHATRV